MDIENDIENDMTPSEEAVDETSGATPEEAHRIGEFDDLRDRLERIESCVISIAEDIARVRANSEAVAIDNGAFAVDVDGDGDGDADVLDDDATFIPDYKDLDLDL